MLRSGRWTLRLKATARDTRVVSDEASAAGEADDPVDCVEPRPLKNGADVAKAKLDAEEACTSLGNIAPGPSSHQPPPVNDAVLSSIVSQDGSWTLLSNRLTTLLGVADQVAEACPMSLDTNEHFAHGF